MGCSDSWPPSPGPIFQVWASVAVTTSCVHSHLKFQGTYFKPCKGSLPPIPHTSASSRHPAGVPSWRLLHAAIRVSRSDSPRGPISVALGGKERSVTRMTGVPLLPWPQASAVPPLLRGPGWRRPRRGVTGGGPAGSWLTLFVTSFLCMALSGHLPSGKSHPAPTVSFSSLHPLSLPAPNIQ